jgi:hypothetical protein
MSLLLYQAELRALISATLQHLLWDIKVANGCEFANH